MGDCNCPDVGSILNLVCHLISTSPEFPNEKILPRYQVVYLYLIHTMSAKSSFSVCIYCYNSRQPITIPASRSPRLAKGQPRDLYLTPYGLNNKDINTRLVRIPLLSRLAVNVAWAGHLALSRRAASLDLGRRCEKVTNTFALLWKSCVRIWKNPLIQPSRKGILYCSMVGRSSRAL